MFIPLYHHRLHFRVYAIMPVPASKVSPSFQRMSPGFPSCRSIRYCHLSECVILNSLHVLKPLMFILFRENTCRSLIIFTFRNLSNRVQPITLRRNFILAVWILLLSCFVTQLSHPHRSTGSSHDFIQFECCIFSWFVFQLSIHCAANYLESLTFRPFIIIMFIVYELKYPALLGIQDKVKTQKYTEYTENT
jgi:hypothetical protein